MPLAAEAHKPPLSEQISDLQQRIHLLTADKSAFYDSSQASIRKKQEMVQRLTEENKSLYQRLAAAGEENITRNISEKEAKMLGQAALANLNRKLQRKKKELNNKKNLTLSLQQQFNQLKSEHERLKAESSRSTNSRARRKDQDVMKLQALEDKLNHTQSKCKEAEKITMDYLVLNNQLKDDILNFPGQLDGLEAELVKHKEELQHLQTMKRVAQLSAELSEAELQQREKLLCKDLKERERYKNKVEEHKVQAEKVERRAQRAVVPAGALSREHSTTRTDGDQDNAIYTVDDAFRQIKEATGLSDIQEIEEAFATEEESRERLEERREHNRDALVQLKEQKEQLKQQFEDMKRSEEEKRSRDQQILKDQEQQLQAAQKRHGEAKERLNVLNKTMSTVQARVEHLAVKLEHIALAAPTTVSTGSRLVDLLMEIDLKLQSIKTELPDLSAIMKMMEDDKIFLKFEEMLPSSNIRVLLPEDQKQDMLDEEDESNEDSDEDEPGIMTREEMKRQSQMIADSKFKKKP